MNCFISSHIDIYYNLALEEFLFKEKNEDFFFLWQSEPVVVVGKHQNPYKELNTIFAVEKGIKIARRLSGGGAVYQDKGNINFTFIKNTKSGKQIDFLKHSQPIFDAIQAMGLEIEYSKRNDLWIEGQKFSGNAEHIFKNRVLHHGTLLYDSDLDILEQILHQKTSNYTDKTIASVKSKVTNLKPYMSDRKSTSDFLDYLMYTVVDRNKGFNLIPEPFSSSIPQLSKEKYASESWIYAYTPKYELTTEFILDNHKRHIQIRVEKGQIVDIYLKGFDNKIVQECTDKLLNQPHIYSKIKAITSTFPSIYRNCYKRLF